MALARLLRRAEARVRDGSASTQNAHERFAGAIEALRLIHAIRPEEAEEWLTQLADRIPHELAATNQHFEFRGAGHRPGRLVRTIRVGANLEDLTIDTMQLFSDGVGVKWSFIAQTPWTGAAPPPLGAVPDSWMERDGAFIPPPPDLKLADDARGEYSEHGWSIEGCLESWSGESYFVPTPAHLAEVLTVRFRGSFLDVRI